MANLHPYVTQDKDILGGTPIFRGTRVPVKTLFDNLSAGDTLDTFLDDFPTVTRELAVAVYEATKEYEGLNSENG